MIPSYDYMCLFLIESIQEKREKEYRHGFVSVLFLGNTSYLTILSERAGSQSYGIMQKQNNLILP